MLLLDDVFELFKDGNWHKIREVMDKFEIDGTRAKEILDFFARSGFLQFDENQQWARMNATVGERIRQDNASEAL